MLDEVVASLPNMSCMILAASPEPVSAPSIPVSVPSVSDLCGGEQRQKILNLDSYPLLDASRKGQFFPLAHYTNN